MDRTPTEGSRRGVRCSLRGGLVGDRKWVDHRSDRRAPRCFTRLTRRTHRPRAWSRRWIDSINRALIPIAPDSARRWRSRPSSLEDLTSLLFHQHSEAEAEERIALLERVIRGYYLLFAAEGLELSMPRRRLDVGLVCRRERLPSVSALGTCRRIWHDARLLPPDVERRGRLRRTEHRSSADDSGKAGGQA